MSEARKKTVIVIPARYGSTRFPGKPLADLGGHPVIYHVYAKAKLVGCADDVIVATDDERIADAVRRFKGNVVMTSGGHLCGTERVAEVARKMDADIIVNVQGDEPLIDPKAVEAMILPLLGNEDIPMSTLMTKIKEEADYKDPNVVKVVVDNKGYAMYFSRAPIPYLKDMRGHTVYRHIGVYAYRRDFLLKLSKMQPTTLERVESLEQLRAIENGFTIKVVETGYDSCGIDTPKDLERIRGLINKKPELLLR